MSLKSRVARLDARKPQSPSLASLAKAAQAGLQAKWAALIASNPPILELDDEAIARAQREIRAILQEKIC